MLKKKNITKHNFESEFLGINSRHRSIIVNNLIQFNFINENEYLMAQFAMHTPNTEFNGEAHLWFRCKK